jgi:microcystin-dependent protein
MKQKIVRGSGGWRGGTLRWRDGGGRGRARALAACVGLLAGSPLLAQTTGLAGLSNPLPIQNMQPSLALHFAVQDQGIFGQGVPIRMFAYSAGYWNVLTSDGWVPPDGRTLPISGNESLFAQLGTTYGGDGLNFFNVPDLRGRTPVGEGQAPGLNNIPRGAAVGNSSPVLQVSNLPPHAHSFGSTTTGTSGSGAAFTNRQDSLGLHMAVARQGIFPTRGGGGGFPVNPSEPWFGQIFFMCVQPTSGNTFLPAVGTSILIQSNQALFSVLSLNFGGNGTTNFSLPDTRGRALSGQATSFPVNGRTARSTGERYGTENVSLLSANLPAHNHPVSGGTFTGLTGGGQPFDNSQPTLAVTYCISVNGIFPFSAGMSDQEGYLGEIVAFGGNFVPDGYLPCDGSLLNIQSYSTLFSLLGTTFGGNGTTNFGIPDLRSRVPIMASAQIPFGTAIGGDTSSINTTQMPAHTHQLLQPPRCQVADIACDNGTPLSLFSGCVNTDVNEGDYNAFFAADGFFFQAGLGSAAIGASCDVSYDSGEPRPPYGPVIPNAVNNGVNEGDYNCFFNFFFLGC